jgi:RsiW-degrading membrane proteinase PrsW (M82 family)
MEWYCKINDEQLGPLNEEDLVRMVESGEIRADTLVKRDESSDWVKLIDSGLVELDSGTAGKDQPNGKNTMSNVERIATNIIDAAPHHVISTFSDLKHMDWKAEVLPIDSSNLGTLMKDSVFWSVVLFGIIPLLIITINGQDMQLTAFALFFAALWGVLFHKFVIKSSASWKWLVASLFITGVGGINLLLWLYAHILPDFYIEMAGSENAVVRLLGLVLQTGICEELIKLLPVLIYVVWKRKAINPIVLIEIGVFSGLGFAAFENVSYGHDSVVRSYMLTSRYGEAGLAVGVHRAMTTTMLRSISLVFCHAVWSGTFAYFVSVAAASRKRIIALFLVGLTVSATLHGVYNWFCGVQPTVAALIAGFSFALFYAYLSKVDRPADQAGEESPEVQQQVDPVETAAT